MYFVEGYALSYLFASETQDLSNLQRLDAKKMKLMKLTLAVLLTCLMFPVTFGQDPEKAQVKSEKRATPKPPPPPIAPVPKKPRQDDDAAKDRLKDESADNSGQTQAASSSNKRSKSIPSETEPRR